MIPRQQQSLEENVTDNLHYRQATLHSMHNKRAINGSQVVGCYSCQKLFKPDEIKEWVDRELDTAVCPHCGVDAVLPGSVGGLTSTLLAQANAYWFTPTHNQCLRS